MVRRSEPSSWRAYPGQGWRAGSVWDGGRGCRRRVHVDERRPRHCAPAPWFRGAQEQGAQEPAGRAGASGARRRGTQQPRPRAASWPRKLLGGGPC